MWKYYKRHVSGNDNGRDIIYNIYRVKKRCVERYVGLGCWVEPPHSGQIIMDIIGMGGGWATIDEITPEEAEEIKRQLFDEEGKRIAPV